MQEKSARAVGDTIKHKLKEAASLMGKHFGSSGGIASAQKLTKKQRQARARNASHSRWNKKKKKRT